MNYEYFLNNDINLLRIKENKEAIINNENKYNFVYFCQNATTDQINLLLDEEGINILLNSNELGTKLNGLITCNHDFDCLKNKELCNQIIKLLDFYYMYGLKNNSALDFYKYVKENNPDRLIELFEKYSDETQIYLLDNFHFSYSEINKLFPYSSKECAKYMLDKYEIFLYDISYYELLKLVDKKIKIPRKCISNNLIYNIVSINDIKTYRILVDKLSNCFDTSIIETPRKKDYLKQISNIENGLLKKYKNIKEEFENEEYGYNYNSLNKNLGTYVYDYKILGMFIDKNLDETIEFENNFQLTNIILDYIFEDVPTNVLLNINNLLSFQKNDGRTLSDEDIELYTKISSIDKMNVGEKLQLFDSIKDLDLKTKFYYDYSTAKDKMVELLNQSILNKENIDKYKNEEMSNKAGVDIYYLNGEKFNVLVKSLNSTKDTILQSNIFNFTVDGSSFSIDGSSKLQTFCSPKEYYNLAYTNIPMHQLIHAFPVDSFSKYVRDKEGLPDRIATSRINNLMTPEEYVSESKNYNELIISVKNNLTKNNEFNDSLKNPEPFALYCYDEITQNDIETAKKYNIGIILVNTKKYNINIENSMSVFETTSLGIQENPYDYVDIDSDERKIRF